MGSHRTEYGILLENRDGLQREHNAACSALRLCLDALYLQPRDALAWTRAQAAARAAAKRAARKALGMACETVRQ